MGRLKTLKPRLRELSTAVAKYPDKLVDEFYTSAEWRGLRGQCLERDGFRCVSCGARAIIADHIVSRRNGGKDELSNLRSLCRGCDNRVKEDAIGQRRGGGEL